MRLDTFTSLLREYEITAEMLYVCLLMYHSDPEAVKSYTKILKLYRDKALTELEKIALIKAGLIEQLPNKKYRTTKRFADIFMDGDHAANEFWNAYPTYVMNNEGKHYPLKNVDIRIFSALYKDHVKTRTEHVQMLDTLAYAVERNYGFVKIDTFIRNRMYEEIMRDMDEDGRSYNSTSINHDF